MFQNSFKVVSCVFQFKDVSRMIEGCFEEFLRVFHGDFKEGKGCFKELSKVFQESFKVVSRKF